MDQNTSNVLVKYVIRCKIKQHRQKFFFKSLKTNIQIFEYGNFIEIITIFWTDLRSFGTLFHISKLSSKQIWFHFTVFVLIQKYYLLSDQNKHFSHWKNTSLSYASLLIISSRDCREADSRDTSPRHVCLGEVTRKIWLHVFAINNNGGSVPVIFISLCWIGCGWGSGWRGNGTCCWGNGICIRFLIAWYASWRCSGFAKFAYLISSTPEIYSKL